MNIPNPYMLPTFNFVGGATQELLFHCFFRNNKDKPFDLSQCTANFAIINYVNKNGAPIVNKTMTVDRGDVDINGEVICNLLRVTLLPTDTRNLVGKFIYQISVKEDITSVDIPDQGIIYITNNINKGYIS